MSSAIVRVRGFAARIAFAASMNGITTATAFFITRADLITCGRNSFPAPNKSATMFIPVRSGPSMTASDVAAAGEGPMEEGASFGGGLAACCASCAVEMNDNMRAGGIRLMVK